MARFTVRLDAEDEDDPGTWVEDEADRRDRTKAWVIREAVNAARGADSVYASDEGDSPDVDADALDAAVDRLLAAVEARGEDAPVRTAPARTDAHRTGAHRTGDDVDEHADVEDVDEQDDPVADVDLPGRGDRLAARRDALRDLYDAVRDADGEAVATADLKEHVDADSVGYASIDSFWSNAVKAGGGRPNALAALPGVEHVGNGRYRFDPDAE
jgi:hypothetical protein